MGRGPWLVYIRKKLCNPVYFIHYWPDHNNSKLGCRAPMKNFEKTKSYKATARRNLLTQDVSIVQEMSIKGDAGSCRSPTVPEVVVVQSSGGFRRTCMVRDKHVRYSRLLKERDMQEWLRFGACGTGTSPGYNQKNQTYSRLLTCLVGEP